MERAGPEGGVSAVLLAAGSSRRFGAGSKLLADAGGRPLIAWAAAALAVSRVAEIIVVTGPDPGGIQAALAGFRVRYAHNPNHLAGMGTSVAAGIEAVSAEARGALVCPGDMPGLTPHLIDRLIAVFEQHGGDRIIYPRTGEGRQGNPVLWPRRLFGRLAALRGQSGGKALLEEHASETLAVPAEGIAASLDIDTLEDLEHYRRQLAGQGSARGSEP
jgi:molybdenum cofactor cytidylyltransferase